MTLSLAPFFNVYNFTTGRRLFAVAQGCVEYYNFLFSG